MQTNPETKPRERIIATAAKLFYDHGINAVGVAEISETAKVSKRTLYHHFATKEALVAAAMTSLGDAWFAMCTDAGSDDPKERIRHVFAMIEPMAENEDFFGCIMMNTSIELRSTDEPAVEVVRLFKRKLFDYFQEQAVLLGVKDPAVLAEQLVLLHDGCCAWIVMRRVFPASTFRTLDLLLREA